MTPALAATLRRRLGWSLGLSVAAWLGLFVLLPSVVLPRVTEHGSVLDPGLQAVTLVMGGPLLALFWYSARAAAGLLGPWWAGAIVVLVALFGLHRPWLIVVMAVWLLWMLTERARSTERVGPSA